MTVITYVPVSIPLAPLPELHRWFWVSMFWLIESYQKKLHAGITWPYWRFRFTAYWGHLLLTANHHYQSSFHHRTHKALILTKDCFFYYYYYYWIDTQATVGYYFGTEGKFSLKFAADALLTFWLIYSLHNHIVSLFKLNWKNSETTQSQGLKILIQEKEMLFFRYGLLLQTGAPLLGLA